MNPYLDRLQSYPFERLATLKAGITPDPAYKPVALSIGEPKHVPPGFVLDVLTDRARLAIDLSAYPATRGILELREAIALWLRQRFNVRVDPERQVLPVAGTREALFSFGQAVLSNRPHSLVVLPNPFYQIYEGAALLRGAEPYFVAATRNTDYQSDFRAVGKDVWTRCELLYLCSPGNPTGTNLDKATLGWLIEQAQRFDFVIAADECYSEIYIDENEPPVGLLQAASEIGNTSFNRCVVFHSLSKRSNLPGLRSGFVAGDANILESYYQYRTYQGCALPNHVQAASIAAWSDETHVIQNRAVYREKLLAVAPILGEIFDVRLPQGGFYFWLPTPEDDQSLTQRLYEQRNITVLPGSYLARTVNGENPGENHVRVAWVAPLAECLTAAQTIVDWLRA